MWFKFEMVAITISSSDEEDDNETENFYIHFVSLKLFYLFENKRCFYLHYIKLKFKVFETKR